MPRAPPDEHSGSDCSGAIRHGDDDEQHDQRTGDDSQATTTLLVLIEAWELPGEEDRVSPCGIP